MTTIGEFNDDSRTVANLIDDIYTAATALTNWSDGDASINNDQSTTDWWNNSKVLQYGPTGEYFLLLGESGDYRCGRRDDNQAGDVTGVRIVRSTSWETDPANISSSAPGIPAGDTDVVNRDPFDGDVSNNGDNRRHEAFTTHEARDSYVNPHLMAYLRNSGAANAGDTINYFGSVGETWLAIATWGPTTDGSSICGFHLIEDLQNPLWTHGVSPSIIRATRYWHGRDDNYIKADEIYPSYSLAWDTFFSDDENQNRNSRNGMVGSVDRGCIDQSEWGYVNPDANDDTFFYRRVPVYEANDQKVPIALLDSVLPAFPSYVAAPHGDTVTADGITYRMLHKHGQYGPHHPTLAWLRWE